MTLRGWVKRKRIGDWLGFGNTRRRISFDEREKRLTWDWADDSHLCSPQVKMGSRSTFLRSDLVSGEAPRAELQAASCISLPEVEDLYYYGISDSAILVPRRLIGEPLRLSTTVYREEIWRLTPRSQELSRRSNRA
jgi:hypothetical protein